MNRFTAAIAALFAFPAALSAATVDFDAAGPFTGPSYAEDILTVFAFPGVHMDGLNGIGVFGGSNDVMIDIGESLNFSFASAVNNISLVDGPLYHNSDVQFEAWNGATYLGLVGYNGIFDGPNPIDISGMFGGGPITFFSATVLGGAAPYANFSEISWGAPAAVPLPATGLLLAGALAGAGALRRRSNRRQDA